MREVFDRVFGPIADSIEIRSKLEWWIKLLFWVILLWPQSGLLWEHREVITRLFQALHLGGPQLTYALLWGLSTPILAFLFIKGFDFYLPRTATVAAPAGSPAGEPKTTPKGEVAKIKTEIVSPFDFKPTKTRFKRDEEPFIQIGDMVYTEKDLYTSVLITGVTGTGKTSAAVFPMLEQVLSIYNEDDEGPLGSIGGLCLDVKGEFFEGVIYYMHKAGRNIFEDIQVIRPNCLMPIVRFKDPSTGHVFYLNAKPCSSGAESWDLIRGKKFKDGSDIPLNIFTFSKRKLESYEPKLKELTFEMGGKKPNYLGWRWQGDMLVRVTHTPKFNETHCVLKDGVRIAINPPSRLVYDGVTFIDNQLRYNIVEPHKPSPEAAMRLNLISTLAEGEKQSGENAYWYKRARSHIGSCIELWRLAYDESPQCTAQAIYKITQQDDYARKQVKLVEQKIKTLQDQLVGITDFGDRIGIEREVERMTSIVKYFTEEWGKYDSKTKTIVGSVVANAFDTFNKDPILQDSFCQPKTFSFEQCIQEGKIFVLVAGDEYETVAKILGTALKMDFQSVVLSRMHRSELNQKRKIMLVNDECQKFVVAGGSQGAGDEHFMSLCRQSRCFNINATQADSWIISVVGKENSDVYLQNYNGRIWFRTNDKETAEKAEQLCGIKKQKTRSAGSEKTIHLENLLLGPKGSADHTPSFSEKEEEKPRFAKDKFYNLEKWECILFNGTRTGAEKSAQSQCEPAYVGSEDGQREVQNVMKLYFQGYLENLAFKQNGGRIFNHIMEEAPTAAAAPAEIPAAPVPFPVAATPASNPISAPATAQIPSIAPLTPPVISTVANTPAPTLSTFGEPDAIKTRVNKLLKSVQVIAPRVSNPAEGTMAPFATPVGTNGTQPVANTPSAAPAPAPKVADTVKEVTPLPRVDKNFSAEAVTPRQLQASMQDYQSDPLVSLQETLKTANFIPPVNPTEYLPEKREEEMQKANNPGLAAERAALGPKGMQGGNPAFAMASGATIEIPKPPSDAFERAREQAVKEDHAMNAKAFVQSVSSQPGPQPNLDTLELLKTLKPETDKEN